MAHEQGVKYSPPPTGQGGHSTFRAMASQGLAQQPFDQPRSAYGSLPPPSGAFHIGSQLWSTESQHTLSNPSVSATAEDGESSGELKTPYEQLRALIAKCPVKEVKVKRIGEGPEAGGSFGDVWKGHLLPSKDLVAIKIPRAVTRDRLVKYAKTVAKELIAWANLSHDNILPLIGVVILPDPAQLWFVSPWMKNKNLQDYLRIREDADLLYMLRGVGRGLTYVHSQEFVHGDLKSNILVDDDGEPRLMDFGLSYNLEDSMATTTSSMFHGSLPWFAPERLLPQTYGTSISQSRSTASDVYALGMVIYEVFTGKTPFYHIQNPLYLAKCITDGMRPSHPGELARPGWTERIWSFVRRCWHHDRGLRPAAADLESVLQDASVEVRGTIIHYQRMIQRARRAEALLDKAQANLVNERQEKSILRTQKDNANAEHQALLVRHESQNSELRQAALDNSRSLAELEVKQQRELAELSHRLKVTQQELVEAKRRRRYTVPLSLDDSEEVIPPLALLRRRISHDSTPCPSSMGSLNAEKLAGI